MRSASPRGQGSSPPLGRKKCNVDHAMHFLQVVFSISGFSDWVLIPVRFSCPHCSGVIRSAPTLFFKVDRPRGSLGSSTCLPFLPQPKPHFVSQCESYHSCAFPLLTQTVQSQWCSAAKARARGVAIPQLKSEPLNMSTLQPCCTAALVVEDKFLSTLLSVFSWLDSLNLHL